MDYANIFNIKDLGTISSVGEMIEQLTQMQSPNGNAELFYRGESKNYETKLLPTAYRLRDKEESFYYYDAITNFPQEFENLSSLSRLAKMQHYWYPTRLLDLTSNPLVALYFACCNNEDEKGCFYVLHATEVLNYDSDRALLLSCLSHLRKKQQESLRKFVLDFIKSDFYDKNSQRINKGYINQKKQGQRKVNISDDNGSFQFERLIGEAVRERVSFLEYNTFARDLLMSYFVRPLIQNDRQKKQDGLFLIMGLLGEEVIRDDLIQKIEVKQLNVKSKARILEELNLLGINQATLFGDLESRVKYLNNPKTN